MEKFTWLNQLSFGPSGGFVAATGDGFACDKPGMGAHYTVAELRAQDSPGWLMSSTAMLQLVAGDERRYLLLKRSDDAWAEPGKWQFPAGRCDVDELPLTTACRELQEEVAIAGAVNSWADVRIRVGGAECEYLTQTTVHQFRARHVMANNTVECYYPMELDVPSFESVVLKDKEAYNRQVQLFTREELLELLQKDLLTAPVAMMVRAELA